MLPLRENANPGEICFYCGRTNNKHILCCPKDEKERELWRQGFVASMDGLGCHEPFGTTFWLGWAMEYQLSKPNYITGSTFIDSTES